MAGELFPELSNADRPQPALTALVEQGRLGVASGAGFFEYPEREGVAVERDRLLTAVLGALAEERAGG